VPKSSSRSRSRGSGRRRQKLETEEGIRQQLAALAGSAGGHPRALLGLKVLVEPRLSAFSKGF
jgi:hypothetical protein